MHPSAPIEGEISETHAMVYAGNGEALVNFGCHFEEHFILHYHNSYFIINYIYVCYNQALFYYNFI